MKRMMRGFHLYVNVNNLNSILKKEENSTDELKKSFHQLDTFVASIENYMNMHSEYAEVEKLTSSRLHIFFKANEDEKDKINALWETVTVCYKLANYISNIGKYGNISNYNIGVGIDFGDFTIFNFSDHESEIEERTTIGSSANRAAKLQSICDDGKVLISKEVYDLLPDKLKGRFFGNGNKSQITAIKYADLTVYEATLKEVFIAIDEEKLNKRIDNACDFARNRANNTNLSDVVFTDCRSKIDYNQLSLRNCKQFEGIMLFSDIRGFTRKFNADGSNLKQMKSLTQIILSKMNSCINKEEGIHIQFQGDRESAFFHTYTKQEMSYSLRALRAALRIMDAIVDLNKNDDIIKTIGREQINVGIGCAYGTIYATRLGLKNNKDNAAMGKTVKEADKAEDEHAGTSNEGCLSEIAITKEFYSLLIKNDDKEQVKIIKDIFIGRGEYYICNKGYRYYIDKLQNRIEEKNHIDAKQNTVKPWNTKK